MVTTVPDRPLSGLQPEQTAMVDICRGGYLTVVEVASHLRQPLAVTRVLLADLLDAGHLVARNNQQAPTGAPSQATDTHILERLLHGLQTF